MGVELAETGGITQVILTEDTTLLPLLSKIAVGAVTPTPGLAVAKAASPHGRLVGSRTRKAVLGL